MKKLLLIFWGIFISMWVNGQLKEFEVTTMKNPSVQVVQGNTQFPDNAMLLIYTNLEGLQFRSSIGGLNKQTYNRQANRYEVLVNPQRQLVFVQHKNYIETLLARVDPEPKEVFYFTVGEKLKENQKGKGTMSISSTPPMPIYTSTDFN